jgi:uncharacterized membrane protein YdbT with pleckstrin-like domain
LLSVDPEPGEIVFFHGHPSLLSLTRFYLKGLLVSVGAGAVAGIATAVAVGHVQTGWVIAAVLLVFVVVLAAGQLRRIQTTYSITNRRLTIETGLLSRRLHQTRLERVQNVNSTQSFLGRLARVGTVDFDTAGESEFDFTFRGVHDPRGIVRTVDRALHERLIDGDPRTGAGV